MTVQRALPGHGGAVATFAEPLRPLHPALASDPLTRIRVASAETQRQRDSARAAGEQPLSVAATAVLRHVAAHDCQPAGVFVVAADLARELCLSASTLRAAFRSLVDAGLIEHSWTTHETVVRCPFLRVAGAPNLGGPDAPPEPGAPNLGGPDAPPEPGAPNLGGPDRRISTDRRNPADPVEGPTDRTERRLSVGPDPGTPARDDDLNLQMSRSRLAQWTPDPIPGVPSSVLHAAAAMFRADTAPRIQPAPGTPNFRRRSGVQGFWLHWLTDNPIDQLRPTAESSVRKCRKCSTTRWRTLSGDGLCERCDGSDQAAVT